MPLALTFVVLASSWVEAGDYRAKLTDRGLTVLWRKVKIVDGSYLRLAKPEYKDNYLLFRSGRAEVKDRSLLVNFCSEEFGIQGVYKVEAEEGGVLVSLKLRLDDHTLPLGPREFAAAMFPDELTKGTEFLGSTVLGRLRGQIPSDPPWKAHGFGPFVEVRIRTPKGFDIVVKSLSGPWVTLHDARGSDWFPPPDRKVWAFPVPPPVGLGFFAETKILIRCEPRKESHRKGWAFIVDKGFSFPVRAIVLGSKARNPEELGAARELQKYFVEMTGRKIPMMSEGRGLPSRGLILLGKGELARKLGLLEKGEFEGMFDDGFIIRERGGNLLLCGKGYRGTVFAVYKLLEMLGCKFLSRECEIVPKGRMVKIEGPFTVKENPAFEWRWFGTTTEAMKCYLDPGIGDEIVGGERMPAVLASAHFWHHPMDGYIPIKKFGPIHPEYLGLRKGKRQTDYHPHQFHPCLSNPEAVKVISGRLLSLMEEKPEARYFTVHVGDSDFWCECPRCGAMDEEPDRMADRVVKWTNAIAEAVAKHYPEKFVTMLAYLKAFRPPLKAVPKEKVLLWFCPIFACQIHPWTEPCTKVVYDALQGWEKVHPLGGKGILTFDYPMNYIHHLVPFPALPAYVENLRLYKRLGIRGVYICGISPMCHLAHLFSYVVPRMMWNPDRNPEWLISQFNRGWFGPAGRPMWKYVQMLYRSARECKGHFNPWTLPPKELLTSCFLSRAYRLFGEAERACDEKSFFIARVWKEKAGLLYADLMLYGRPVEVTLKGEEEQLTIPSEEQLGKLAEFLKIAAHFQWGSVRWRQPLEDWLAKLLGHRPEGRGWFPWWEDPIVKSFVQEPVRTFEREMLPRLRKRVSSVVLENEDVTVVVLPPHGGRIRSIFLKGEKVELLKKFPIPLVYSTSQWVDLGGYEEYAGEEFASPGWGEEYEVVKVTGREVVLRCGLPEGLTIERRVAVPEAGVVVEVESILKNESKKDIKGAMLRVHPEFSFGLEGGPEFFIYTAQGWRRVKVESGGNWLRGDEKPLGAWAVYDKNRGLYLVNFFDPSQVSACMIFVGSLYYNLELFSLRKDLRPGEAIVVKHRYEVLLSLP